MLSDQKLSPTYKAFAQSVSSIIEPHTFSQVVHPEWRQAMSAELQALEDNGTWFAVSLPSEKSVVGCKWVYKAKFLADGTLERHKTRLVAKVIHNKKAWTILKRFLQLRSWSLSGPCWL